MKKIISKLFQKIWPQTYIESRPLNIDTSQTKNEFKNFANEIVEFLVSKLRMLDKIESEIHARYRVLVKKRNIPNQTHPEEKDLWKEYAQRCEEIISPFSVEKYNGSARTFGEPTKYKYFTDPKTKIFFIMKSENRAVVETEFEEGIKKKEQFILKKDEKGWKIDTKKYSFPDEVTWWKDEI